MVGYKAYGEPVGYGLKIYRIDLVGQELGAVVCGIFACVSNGDIGYTCSVFFAFLISLLITRFSLYFRRSISFLEK
jgi:hypothetical protein